MLQQPIDIHNPRQLRLPPTAQNIGIDRRATVDSRVRRYISPKRVIWQSARQPAVCDIDALLTDRCGQLLGGNSPENNFVLDSSAGTPGILLDFGIQLHGGIQISVVDSTHKPVRMRIRFGESAMEAMSEVGKATNATNDHAQRDGIIEIGQLSTREVGQTGFRFVRLDLVEPNARVEIRSIQAVLIYKELEYAGSFRCNDELLNLIWNTGAYTVHLNMQEYLWDGIKRDRLVWIGDMHPETSTIQAVFGYDESVPLSLDLARDSTPSPKWMNNIASYSMWWLIIQHQWYLQNGNILYLQEQKSYLSELLANLLTCVGDDGREQVPDTRFLDWDSEGDAHAQHVGLQALLILAMEAGEALSNELGMPDLAAKCTSAVQKLRTHRPDHLGNKQPAALMVLAGLADPQQTNTEVLAVDGTRGISTFYGFYVLQARALAGDITGALDCIRQFWGGMISLGATTFWESFNIDWLANAARIDELTPYGKVDVHGNFGDHCFQGYRHSLCHGWASGPTAWLTQHVLGVSILEPGCRKVLIAPNLGDLKWAEGTYPTPLGVISIRHEKNADGKIQSSISAPTGIEIVQNLTDIDTSVSQEHWGQHLVGLSPH